MANHSEHKQAQPPSDAAVVPVWLKALLGLAAFVIIVAGMKAAATILVPFLLALFAAIISAPALFWMRKKGVNPAVAIILVTTLLLVCGFLVGSALAQSIPSLVGSLPQYSEKLRTVLTDAIAWAQSRGIPIDASQLQQIIRPDAGVKLLGELFGQIGAMTTEGALIFLMLVLILLEAATFESKLNSLPNSRQSTQRLYRIANDVKRYIAVKTSISLIIAVLITAWLLVLKVDYAVVWGLLTFVLMFVPNIGAVLAVAPPLLLAFIQLGITKAILVGVGYGVICGVLGNSLELLWIGQRMGLSTLVVFLSLVFWGWVLGPVGMLLSVPLTMAVKIVLQSNDDTRWIAILLGSGPTIYREKAEKK
ncbi:MAG: AI-2E family transporter [Planctomycetes bacterium]|nr:AI-2E family transporter [Planctomycetota bacterium]